MGITLHVIKIIQIITLLLTGIWSVTAHGQEPSAAHEPKVETPDIGQQENQQQVQSSPEQRWVLNQQNADIREFIAQIAGITGKSFVLDPRIKSGNTVSVISSRSMTRTEIYDIFLEVLNANGFSVVPKGSSNTIVPNTTVKTAGRIVEGDENPANATLVTQVIDLHSVSAVEVIPIVRPLIAQYGHAAASASGNAIVISDHKSNVERITRLVRELDNASDNDYEVLALQHIWVGDIAKLIQETLSGGKGQLPSGVQVLADERSNRLVIKGNANKRAKIRKLVETLDRKGVRQSSTRVIFLRHADAKNIADMLNEVSGAIHSDSQAPSASSNQSSTAAARGTTPRPTASKSRSSRGKLANGTVIRADETTNALVIIADPDTLNELESLVRQLDIRRSQVLIEAAIVEVSGDIDESLGLQWGYQGKRSIGEGTSIVGAAVGTSDNPNPLQLGSVLLRNSNFGVLIKALSSKSNINLMSTPSLMTLDNEESEFVVGQEVSFTTGSYQKNNGDTNNPFKTSERKPVGLTLKVTPHIGEGNTLRLEIDQEMSSLTQDSIGENRVTSQRKLKTVVIVDDQETIVLGGILRDIVTRRTQKVPVLGSIPLFGLLFRNKQDINQKQNLMLFLKPTIIRTGDDASSVTLDKYSTLKAIHGRQHESPLLNQMPPNVEELFDASTPAPVTDPK